MLKAKGFRKKLPTKTFDKKFLINSSCKENKQMVLQLSFDFSIIIIYQVIMTEICFLFLFRNNKDVCEETVSISGKYEMLCFI